ncbi:MAG TPA: hypothetical protein VGM06_04995 [Polyangiaceae bacterium]|jgi:hypothetical protein
MRGGALDASVTLEEVLAAVSGKRVPLAPELAGYLVLELSEHADPAGGDVDPKSVFVSDEGTVALVRSRRDRVIGDAEASIRATLGRLLDASGSQTPALSAAVKRRSGAGLDALSAELEAALIPVNRAAARRALARLAREVKRVTLGVGRHTLSSSAPPKASLREPLSFVAESSSPPPAPPPPPLPAPVRPRQAFSSDEDSTRARSALPRDLVRSDPPARWNEDPAGAFEHKPPVPSEADIDALIAQFRVSDGSDQQHARALKAIAELEPTPAPPPGGARIVRRAEPQEKPQAPSPRESDIEALLAMNDESPAPSPPSIPPLPGPPLLASLHRPATPTRGREVPPVPSPAPRHAAATSERPPSSLPTSRKMRPTMPSTSDLRPRRRGSAWLSVVAVAALAGGGFAAWRLRGDLFVSRSPAPAPPAPAPTGEPAPACLGTLVLTDVPARAEVLLREGQAPVEIPRMPVGARLEFVATAEGYAPKRVVVPGGVPWDPAPDGKPRFEAAVQLDPSKAHGGGNDPWPVGEPGSAVGGEGPPGTVRVVANPRGAEVWMLAGIAPEARIERLRCDQDIDVLLAGPTTYRNRLRVKPSDFVVDDAPQPPGAPRMPGKPRIARVSAK